MYMEQVIQIRKCVVCVFNFIDILMDVCLMSECVNKTMFFCYLFACYIMNSERFVYDL